MILHRGWALLLTGFVLYLVGVGMAHPLDFRTAFLVIGFVGVSAIAGLGLAKALCCLTDVCG